MLSSFTVEVGRLSSFRAPVVQEYNSVTDKCYRKNWTTSAGFQGSQVAWSCALVTKVTRVRTLSRALALRPTAKLTYDTGQGSQYRTCYSTDRDVIQTVNRTIDQQKRGVKSGPTGYGRAGMQQGFYKMLVSNAYFVLQFYVLSETTWF